MDGSVANVRKNKFVTTDIEFLVREIILKNTGGQGFLLR